MESLSASSKSLSKNNVYVVLIDQHPHWWPPRTPEPYAVDLRFAIWQVYRSECCPWAVL